MINKKEQSNADLYDSAQTYWAMLLFLKQRPLMTSSFADFMGNYHWDEMLQMKACFC